MPARSVSQRHLMAMCEHDPAHVKGQCPDMSKAELHDFAATKEAGLPPTAPKPRNSYRRKPK